MRTAVVLPAPLGPRTAVTVPVGTSRSMPAEGGRRAVALHQAARFDGVTDRHAETPQGRRAEVRLGLL